MTLCLSRPFHTMAHPGRTSQGVSLEDFHCWAENERQESGRQSRSQTLDEILSATIYRSHSKSTGFSSRPSRPVSASATLPSVSRPNTVCAILSRFPNDVPDYRINRDIECTSAPPDLPSSTMTINKCMRSQSAIDREMSDLVGSLARQCCDVLGPHVCNQCAKLKRRDDNVEDSESTFPNLQTSEDNFTKSVLVNSYLPEMTPYQIQTKIARGEIALDSFRSKLQRLNTKTIAKAIETKPTSNVFRQRCKTIAEDGATDTFFTSIQHLNQKIVSGRMDKKLYNKPKDGKNENVKNTSVTDCLYPRFISPRKYNPPQSSYRTYFDPPLLPKACQKPAPSFFAGESQEYKLPDRLPEVIVFEGGEVASVDALAPPSDPNYLDVDFDEKEWAKTHRKTECVETDDQRETIEKVVT